MCAFDKINLCLLGERGEGGGAVLPQSAVTAPPNVKDLPSGSSNKRHCDSDAAAAHATPL